MSAYLPPRLQCLVAMLSGAIWICAAEAQEPLHARIDQLIAARAGGPLAERTSGAEFLRRVYLDFAGTIPTSTEAAAFLADNDSDQRRKLIDQLLADPRHVERMTDLFNVMLLERRASHDEWLAFLRNSFAANKPWDQMVREILAPDAEDESKRGAAFFYSARLQNYGQNPPDVPGLVRDIGRLFLGVDVQCAQCHDHLFVDDYKQADYQGLYAFVGTAFLRQDTKFPAVGEKPLLQKVTFQSVFDGVQVSTGPRLPGGTEIDLPVITKGDEYLVPPDKTLRTPGVLKFSPLRALAEALPRGDNLAFSRNIANRLWWLMMGRGLVDPLDLHHTDNPPSHPELLDLLASELVKHDFDIKWMLRELALSETYQRGSVLPAGTSEQPPLTSYRVALERPLSPAQLLAALLAATGRQVTGEKQLGELRNRFDKAFANPPKEPEVQVNPTVKAALFLSNDEVLLSWFEAQDGNLVDRVVKLADAGQIVEEIYLSVLTRRPTDEERTAGEQFLRESGDDRQRAIGYLSWALAASTEFFVNH